MSAPPDHSEREDASVVLFDGRCDLCQNSRKWAQRLDWLHHAQWVNFRDPAVRAAVPQLTEEQLDKEMWVFTADGRMLPGFFGWRHLLLGFPLTFLPALLMFVPPVPWLGRRVYAFIAARRPVACRIHSSTPAPTHLWAPVLQRASASSAPSPEAGALKH